MTPDFVEKRDVDLDEWTETRTTGFERRAGADEDDVVPPVMGRKRFCVDCGSPVPDGVKNCPSCGREQ